jgi:hypothetical protein
MFKELSQDDRVEENTIDFLTAPKRKRENDITGEITSWSSMKQHHDAVDGDFVYPSHKRSASSNRLPFASFYVSLCDSEQREGPADDESLDDETAALVSNFRTSILRQGGQMVSPQPSPTTSLLGVAGVLDCTLYKENIETNGDDEGEEDIYFPDLPDFPSIVRATTITDPSDASTYDESCHADPPDMVGGLSTPTSLQVDEMIEQDLHEYNEWSTSSSSTDYPCRGEKDEIEMARDRTGSISSPELSGSTPLWNTSTGKDVLLWPPAAWTEMYNQENA